MSLTGFLHAAHLGASLPAHRGLVRALADPERAQRRRLAVILGHLARNQGWGAMAPGASYEVFREQIQPCTYVDLEGTLEAQRNSGLALASPARIRWQPTSGSTSRRKWIPYPPVFLSELDAAVGAWMVDLALRHPRAFRGRHYWSLSWVPSELRQGGMEADDLTLLPAWKRLALGRAMAVPNAVGGLPSNAEAMLASAAWLASRSDLSLLSVWSPTFGFALLRALSEHREAIAETLESGSWSLPLPAPRNRKAAGLLREWDGQLAAPFFAELWPRLSLLSAWDSAGSQSHARQLGALLPQAHLQGKGLWATEGVVTIPFQEQLPLALTSHFLEFRCLATGRILPAWELQVDQELQPLLTTSAGLLRYALDDCVKVTGFLQRTPCLAFQGRLGGTDMVGEKLDARAVAALLEALAKEHGIRCFTLFALESDPPHYCLLAEGASASLHGIGSALEAALCTFHHYRLARELLQLGSAEVLLVPDGAAFLARRAELRGSTSGEAKLQPLEVWGLRASPHQLAQPSPNSAPH